MRISSTTRCRRRARPSPGKPSAGRIGFTLVEILAVVAIVVLLATIWAVQLHHHMAHATLETTAGKLLRMATWARQIAGQYRSQCLLHIDTKEGTYWLTVRQIAASGEMPGDESAEIERATVPQYPQNKVYLPDSVRFGRVWLGPAEIDLAPGQTTIEFNLDGSSQAALIQLHRQGRAKTILIYPHTGRVVLRDGAIEEPPVDFVDLDARTAGMEIGT